MLFSSPIFLFLFLPFTLALYYITPKRFKNLILLLVSIGFYTWGEKQLVLLILASALVDYFAARIIENGKRKLGLYISICFNLLILGYFKYSNFIFSNVSDLLISFGISDASSLNFEKVILPLGISFYTFQTMSYTIDVYRGHVKANSNFIDFAMYVSLFPQLIAGPIIRYKDIEKDITNRVTTNALFAKGIERFIIGLAKKMIIANNCAFLVDSLFAIGFKFPENFNYPYISKSIQEFWRRWHISLSSWFKEYLYISLGGNRNGVYRTYINLFIVFFVTGLWHGASWSFIVWGIAHGLFIIIEKLGLQKVLKKLGAPASHLYALFAVNVTWPLFICDSISDGLEYMRALFSFGRAVNTEYLSYYLSNEILIVSVIGIILSMPIYKLLEKTIRPTKLNYSLKSVGLLILFIICCMYVATDTYNPFIYFRF